MVKGHHTFILFISCYSLYAVVHGQCNDFVFHPCTLPDEAVFAPAFFEDEHHETITHITKNNGIKNAEYKVSPVNMFTLNKASDGAVLVHLKEDLVVKLPRTYSFKVEINYMYNDGNKKDCWHECAIEIKAVNRYEPKFNTSAVQKILVEENKEYPKALLTLEAEDEDRNRGLIGMKELHFRLQASEDQASFKIKSTQQPDGKYIVQLFLNSTLDYEYINFYTLTIIVEDESEDRVNPTPKKSASIDIYLNVDDVHDQPPQFITECGLKKLEEQTPAGTEVKTVTAIDSDIKIRSPVKYAIIHDNDDDTRSERSIVEKYFAIDSKTGKLTVKESPDRESEDLIETSTITFVIQATEYNITTKEDEKVNGTANTTCIILITDIDDNPARFELDFYNATLLENSPKSTVVVLNSATVNDKDLAENATYFLYLVNEDKIFVVTPADGQNNITFFIRVEDSKPLDYEREDLVNKSLSFQVFSKGKQNGNHICSANITVNLLDENDNYPIFEPLGVVEVSENASVGYLVATVKATDIDSGDYGTKGIRYRIPENPQSNSFHINEISGEIRVKENHTIDREQMDELMLPVDAIDDLGRGLRNSTQIRIKVLDANDQAPIFSIKNYPFSLLENEAVFQSSMPLQAFDKDEPNTNNSIVNYEILKSEFSDHFQIDASQGIITPKTPLDFESSEFRHMSCNNRSEMYICVRIFELVVQAYDLGIPRQYSEINANVTIDFTDVNDNVPKFSQMSHEETIKETVSPGTTVLKVKATDADISPNYNQVYYSLSDMNQYNFIINRKDGQMTVAKGANLAPEDNDAKKIHILMVQATDGLEEQMEEDWCKVTVNIIDVNNKAPVFVKNSFIESGIQILEEQPTFWVIQFAAYDPDETQQLEFRIDYKNSEAQAPFPVLGYDPPRIEDYDFRDKFTIDGETGVLSVTAVDRERLEKINLHITVTDLKADPEFPDQTATYFYHITVLDINDNDPIFINNSTAEGYSKSVYENMEYSPLLEIRAIDIDGKDNNTVFYELDLPDVAKGVFKIDKNKGIIDMTEVDYEEYHFMNFTVIATDSGYPPRNSRALVNITIIDVNDNKPIFETDVGNYTREVWENATIGGWVMTVIATDRDSGEFGRVNYMFRDNNPDNSYFDIGKENGSITIKKKLTYQVHKFELYLTVRAYDNPNSSNNLDAEQRITIKILDVNDNPPIFDEFPSSFSVSEVEKSYFGRLKATDKDEPNTPNTAIEFSIVGGKHHEFFRVELESGFIFFNRDMNRMFGIYNITFMAKDRGDPPLNSTKVFEIDVYDVNNHAPEFTKPKGGIPIEIAIKETTELQSTVNRSVITVEAVDYDRGENASIIFSLSRETQEQQEIAAYFRINGTTGEIIIAANLKKKDRPEFLLTIFAEDRGTPPKRSEINALVKILVESEIDSLPYFEKLTAAFNFTENCTTCAEKQLVPKAQYKKEFVEDLNAPICYFIIGGDVELFHLDKNNREMTVKDVLDREEHAFHAVSVLAHKDCDQDVANLVKLPESVVNITVGVTDVNDNSPIFTKKVFAGRMTTVRTLKGDIVANVLATDLDEGPNAEIEYSIYSEIRTEEAENIGNTDNAFDFPDKKKGEIRVNFQPQKNMKGYFSFTVIAKDIGSLNDTAEVLIYLMREDQQITITIRRKESTLTDAERSTFEKIFEKVTEHYCIVDKWEPHNTTEYAHYTIVTMHLVNRETNKILEPAAAEKLVDSKLHELQTETGSNFPIQEVKQKKQDAQKDNPALSADQLQYVYLGVAAGLALCLLVTLAISCLKLSSMRRTLKAATVPAFGSQDSGLNRIGVQAAPNTNQHTIEGSNPIWNQQDDLKFHQPDIESETVSINSMDLNMMGYPAEKNDFMDNETVIMDKPPIIEKVANQSNGTNKKKKTKAPEPPKDEKLYKKNTINTLKNVESDWRRRHTQGELQLDPTRLPIASQPDNDQQRRLSLFIRPEKSSEL